MTARDMNEWMRPGREGLEQADREGALQVAAQDALRALAAAGWTREQLVALVDAVIRPT